MKAVHAWALALCGGAILGAWACAPSGATMGGSGEPPAAHPDSGSGSVEGHGGTEEELSPDGGNCGLEKFVPSRLPPEMLIVLDQSGSMDDPASSGGSKWSQTAEAMRQTVKSSQGDIAWGIEFFPLQGDTSCTVPQTVSVPVGLNQGTQIVDAINRQSPAGGTPTAQAVLAAMEHLSQRTTPNPKFILLATDGKPSCPDFDAACTCPDGTPSKTGPSGQPCCDQGIVCLSCGIVVPEATTVTAIEKAAAKGIHTFVVGIALEAKETAAMDKMAEAGKEARAATPRFFPVASQAELSTTINSIAKGVLSCTLTLSKEPPNPLFVGVFSDGQKVSRDPKRVDGWEWVTPTSLQLFGPPCEKLKAGGAAKLEVVFGCSLIN